MPRPRHAVRFVGPCTAYFAELEVGTHLFASDGLSFTAIRARRLLVPGNTNLGEVLSAETAVREAWLQDVSAGRSSPDSDPDGLLPMLRIVDAKGLVMDVRTNTLSSDELAPAIRRSVQTSVMGQA